ncbi:MAG TPA: DoxX family protein [Clostridia bacterium]|nr:DoxX family protein [Clostridia bacterium]
MNRLNQVQPVALMVLRVVLGIIMLAHGYGKVFGGMHKHVEFVSSLGMPGWMAYPSAGAEFIGGILLIVGVATRFAALAVLLDMLVAIFKVHLHQGLKGGYEFPLALATIAFMLIFYGGGPISVDWLFGDSTERRH